MKHTTTYKQPHLSPGTGKKVEVFFFFSMKVVMLPIKVTGMDHSPTCKQKFCTYALHICDPCDGVKRWKHFSEYGHVTHEIKGNETYDKMKANSLPLYTLLTPGMKPKGKSICF